MTVKRLLVMVFVALVLSGCDPANRGPAVSPQAQHAEDNYQRDALGYWIRRREETEEMLSEYDRNPELYDKED